VNDASAEKKPAKERRVITAPERSNRLDQAMNVRRTGAQIHPLTDAYYFIMRASWPRTLLLIFTVFSAINLIYAAAYTLVGGIENARPGNFEDAFFFSVQTLATIGYGKMAPASRMTNFLVMLEAFSGILATTITTGLLFAKFSRPTSRVFFSNVMLVSARDGIPTLQFRMANARGNQIMQAAVQVVFSYLHVTAEGENLRRLVPLKLTRSESALFALSWTAFHHVDEASPLFGRDAAWLKKNDAGFIVSLVGLDETLGQTVHARHSWDADCVVFGGRFVDVMTTHADGTRELNLDKLHDYVLDEPVA